MTGARRTTTLVFDVLGTLPDEDAAGLRAAAHGPGTVSLDRPGSTSGEPEAFARRFDLVAPDLRALADALTR